MISLSFDIDWAVDEVVEHCLDVLNEFEVKATFFATHKSPILDSAKMAGHEIGLHPNFLPHFQGEGRPYKEVIDEMIELFPKAVGVRFHSLATSNPAIDYCREKGIKYDSSLYVPTQVPPFPEYKGILRIPFQKADLQMILDGDELAHDERETQTSLPYVYLFHPMHVFLNTEKVSRYNDAKKHYKNFAELKQYRNTETDGVETLLRNILTSGNNFVTMNTIFDQFVPT